MKSTPRLRGDFNGCFGDLLYLSHEDFCRDENGDQVLLCENMQVTVFDEEFNEQGERDDLLVSGVVEQSPNWLQCRGSRWVLRIDANGFRNESEIVSPRAD